MREIRRGIGIACVALALGCGGLEEQFPDPVQAEVVSDPCEIDLEDTRLRTFGFFITPTADRETYSREPILRPPAEGVDFSLGFSNTSYCGTSSRLEPYVGIRRIKGEGEDFEGELTRLHDCDGDGRMDVLAHSGSSYGHGEWLVVQKINMLYMISREGTGDGPFSYTITPWPDLNRQGKELFEESAREAERLLREHNINCMAAAYLRGEDIPLPNPPDEESR